MYNYAIIRENYKDLKNERVLLSSKWKNKKYAMLVKSIHKDGSESITHIKYSDNLDELQERANGFVSWYNYPSNLSKSIQGYISEIG